MNYANIIPSSCVDFNGWSTIIQLSGCSHNCIGCFNTSAMKSNYGSEFTEEVYQEVLAYASKPFISNVVLQGGDPMFFKSVDSTIELCRKLKRDLPEKNVVMFTGYTYEELQQDLLRNPILNTIDYLMDGKFECENPTDKPFRGSDNQVLHKLVNGMSVERT